MLQKLSYDQILEFSKRSKLLDPYQTDFKKFHSTQSTLLKLTDDIRLGMDRKLSDLLLEFDFSKAFDTISTDLSKKLLREFLESNL